MGKILVWPDKYINGIATLNGPHVTKDGKPFTPELGHPMELLEALEARHSSDAHVTTYGLLDEKGNPVDDIPLMKKHVLKEVQAEGCKLMLNAIGLDWDTPGHIPLTPELLTSFLTSFMTACSKDDRLADWAAYYTSRHGTRVFYILKEPVPVEDGEKYIVSIIKEFKEHGVTFDTSCRDWTRRFRLPKVDRDGLRTEEEPMFDMQMQDNLLDVKRFKKSDLRSLVVATEFVRKMSHPTQEECTKLLSVEDTQGRKAMSHYYKKAKTVLKNTQYWDALFTNNVKLCGESGRNDFFRTMLGRIVPLLIEKCRASSEQIFALLYGPLCGLELVAGKQDPAEFCWNMLQDFYERDYAKFIEAEEKKAQAIDDGQTALQRMAEGMKQWCENEALWSEDNTVVEAFVLGHLFANVGHFYYPMNEDGWYESIALLQGQLVPRVRKCFLKDIICTERQDMKGELVSISPVEIANKHSTVIHEVRMSPLQGVRGRIDDMDGNLPILQLPMYQRNNNIPPVFNKAVDGWLRALFGEKQANLGMGWIGYALDFEAGPICALSITGGKGVGKKMLVEGLAECLEEPASATGRDMCGGTNGALIKTPFLVVNEGLPKSGDMSPSDLFKSYTAGDAISVRELYKPRINVINPLRIILTANDHDILKDITKGKELTADTRAAMGERILHFDVNNAAAEHLERLGGRAFTEMDGARWIRGDSGQKSDFVVAKHFMWLYAQREKIYPRNKQNRYCVMGNCGDASCTFQIASGSESLATVMRGLIGLFENPGSLKQFRLVTKTGKAYITLEGCLAYVRDINGDKIGERALESVVQSVLVRSNPYVNDRRNYYELDVQRIVEFAEHWGSAVPVLRRQLAIQRGEVVV
jgi:hypothetical protein